MGQETFAAMQTLLRTPEILAAPGNGADYPAVAVGNSLRQAAQLIKADLGTRSIYVNVPGAFDTHSNQTFNNTLEFQRLGDSLAAFSTDLGRLMDDVVVIVTTEFGRTAAVNGSAGTDHGSGYCMIVMGGGVRGGRIYGAVAGPLADAALPGARPRGHHRLPRRLCGGGAGAVRDHGRLRAVPRLLGRPAARHRRLILTRRSS